MRPNLIRLLLIIIFCFSGLLANGQISVPDLPESFKIKFKQDWIIRQRIFETPDTLGLLKHDIEFPNPFRYGICRKTDINIIDSGLCVNIPDKGRIWLYKIASSKAWSLGITFSHFKIPVGAKLFIYNEDHSIIYGAFTHENNNDYNLLTVAEFPGDQAIIEYFEPCGKPFTGELRIGLLNHGYRNIFDVKTSKSFSNTLNLIDINCSEGDGFRDIKHAIVKITFNDSYYSYVCSGALINNVRIDGIPYLLTANHCISADAVAKTVVAYFNFESSGCNSGVIRQYKTLSGANLVRNQEGSDFSLLLLNNVPPDNYQAYYAGWDVSGLQPLAGICIHHPDGGIKSIAIDNHAVLNYGLSVNWDQASSSPGSSHWQVKYDLGQTASGSSGSPLLDQKKRIVGQLHGGDSIYDYFGKLSYSWNNGLSAFLDPDNKGVKVLNGYFAASIPEPNFNDLKFVCINAPITLKDESYFYPTAWNWSIYPKDFTYVNGSDSSWQNPQVIFSKRQDYMVSLQASNSIGSGYYARPNAISAVNSFSLSLNGMPDNGILCGHDLSYYKIVAEGAPLYTYEFAGNLDRFQWQAHNDSLFLSLNDTSMRESFETTLKLAGYHGTCLANLEKKITVQFPVNDLPEFAIDLVPGPNGPFPNRCAAVYPLEPQPPGNACISQSGWCSNYTDTSIRIQHPLWFKFKGPPSGFVSIRAEGFDTEIALWEAGSYKDLMNGSQTKYSLIAANDNINSYNNSSEIEKIKVTPGNNYWIQLDGSLGTVGEAIISLFTYQVEVYPNPSNGNFTIHITYAQKKNVLISIYSSVGSLVYNAQLSNVDNAVTVPVSLQRQYRGIYFVKIVTDDNTYLKKIMIY